MVGGGGSAVLKRTVHSPLAPLQVLEKGKGLWNQPEVCGLTMCVPDWAPPEILVDTFELVSVHSLSEFKDKGFVCAFIKHVK